VLRPHDGEDPEFDETRLAAKQFLYSLEFLLCEVVGGDNFGSNHLGVRRPGAALVFWLMKFFILTKRRQVTALQGDLLFNFLNHLVYCFAQFGSVDAADVLVNDLTLFVVQESRRQAALPCSIDEVDNDFGI